MSTITSPSTATFSGGLFKYQITANNSPVQFGATGLPGGLHIRQGGIIAGMVLPGTYAIGLTATNAAGDVATGTLTLTVTTAPAGSAPRDFEDEAKYVCLVGPDGSPLNGTASDPSTVGSAPRVSQGGYYAPTASANGTELSNRPSATSGVRFELSSGASITYFFAPTGQTPSSAPAYTKTVTVAGTTDEPVSGSDSVYVTAVGGTIIFRWVQR